MTVGMPLRLRLRLIVFCQPVKQSACLLPTTMGGRQIDAILSRFYLNQDVAFAGLFGDPVTTDLDPVSVLSLADGEISFEAVNNEHYRASLSDIDVFFIVTRQGVANQCVFVYNRSVDGSVYGTIVRKAYGGKFHARSRH